MEKLAALLSSNCDKKMLLTTMMFIQNILSADFIFKVILSTGKEIAFLTSRKEHDVEIVGIQILFSIHQNYLLIMSTSNFFPDFNLDFYIKFPQERISFLKESSRESLLKVVGGVLKSEKCKKSKLYQVALALNDTLLNEDREK